MLVSRKAFRDTSAPFLICAGLLYFPYLLFGRSELFAIDLSVGKASHAILGVAVVLGLGISYFVGVGKGDRAKPMVVHRRIGVERGGWLWLIVALSIVVHVWFLYWGALAYSAGGFYEARRAVEIQGIGSIIRLPLVILPLLAFADRGRNRLKIVLGLVVVLSAVRAFIMSERTAIVEIVCLAWILVRLDAIHISRKAALITIVAGVFFFYLILSVRLDDQSKYASVAATGSEAFIQSLSAYYADTMNKFYQAVGGSLQYPEMAIFAPIKALIGTRAELKATFADYLAAQASFSSFFSTTLNNPGGLAEDVSDFGLFGLFVAALKFCAFGFVLARIKTSTWCRALSVIILIALLEYPRFNYIYLPFVAYLGVAAIMFACFVMFSLKSRGN